MYANRRDSGKKIKAKIGITKGGVLKNERVSRSERTRRIKQKGNEENQAITHKR
jgi:hypothetical protein